MNESIKRSGSCHCRMRFQLVVMLAIGVVLFMVVHRVAAYIVWAICFVLAYGLWFSPPVLRGFEAFGRWLSQAVGRIVTVGLLAPFFYIVFSLGHLLLLLRGSDPLQCKRVSKASSYWTVVRPRHDGNCYRKQY